MSEFVSPDTVELEAIKRLSPELKKFIAAVPIRSGIQLTEIFVIWHLRAVKHLEVIIESLESQITDPKDEERKRGFVYK